MPISPEIKKVFEEINFVERLYQKLIKVLPAFDITDKKVLPYGLKPDTRSVSWIVEQVIIQQTKFRAKELELDDVNFNMPDTCLHDCEIKKDGKTYFVNVKISNTEQKENKNNFMQELLNKIFNEDMMKGIEKVPDNSVDLILTDPPYGLGKDYGNGSDKRCVKEYLQWSHQWIDAVISKLKDSGSFYLFLSWRFSPEIFSYLE